MSARPFKSGAAGPLPVPSEGGMSPSGNASEASGPGVQRVPWSIYRFVMRIRYGRQWPMATSPIPDEDVARAAKLARERGWEGIQP